MATGFRISGEGDLDQIYVTPAEIQALRDEGRLTLQIQSHYGERRLWTWGANGQGQLGVSSTLAKSSPVQVGSLTNWKQLTIGTAGTHTAAVKTDGTLWAWGSNTSGQLGLGDLTARSSPVQVGLQTNWAKVVAMGGNFDLTAAVKTDGTLWTWGDNPNGQLGLGDTAHRSSPVQVGALTTWSSVSLANSFALALKSDGTLWSWGNNTYGQLGLGDAAQRSSPVQVGALTDWKQVANGGLTETFSASVKTDGSLWTWGTNTYGQLGLGDTTSRSSPVRVGALTDWKQVAVGAALALAVKTDGTLWAWGYNLDGRLGLGDTAHRSSPVQVGALTNWKSIHVSGGDDNRSALALKTDGTLWAWGNSYSLGELGLGDLNPRSSPVQVGSQTDWVAPYLRQS